MKEKHGKSNETDITGVLVVALFVMLGILFVTLSNTLTKKTTSTSTRASDVNSVTMTLPSSIAYGDPSCPAGQKGWFGICIAVNAEECIDKCPPAQSIADKTSYGKETCRLGKTRCLPLKVPNSVSGYFNFNNPSTSDGFCIKSTGQSGAVCYTKTGINNVSEKNINKYNIYYAEEDPNNAPYLKKKFSFFGPAKYKIECPLYVTIANRGLDIFLWSGGMKSGFDHIESGYCYVPKSITPTPIK